MNGCRGGRDARPASPYPPGVPISVRRAFRELSRTQRVELFKLAQRGEQHPDPSVAKAARAWANDPGWNRRSNRLPGWLLPLTGLAYTVLGILLGLPIGLALCGIVVLVIGLLGWVSTGAARQLRKVYADHRPVAA